ncbi:hypothetical protein B0O99DRAFT_248028 [Bisporella sp. PMI_857]|nr:hypothetical protein B0O99DRAFT_248028 [Bisporella sp. PMI_857]
MSDRAKTKAARLRAACNQCNTTKIKCSGERTGCSRCRTLQVLCIYSESRVGRVPGMRAKKKNYGDSTSGDNVNNDNSNTNGNSNATIPETINVDASNVLSPLIAGRGFEDGMVDWSNGLTDNDIFHDTSSGDFFVSLANDNPRMLPTSPSADFTFNSRRRGVSGASSAPFSGDSGLDFESTQISQRPFQPLHSRRPSISGHTASATDPRNGGVDSIENKRNSQCVTTCAHVILTLQKYLDDNLKLTPFVEHQRTARDIKSLGLFSVLCHQIMELLDAGCQNFFEETDQNQSQNTSKSPDTGFSGLGFDPFVINSRAQRRLRSQIILDKIQPFAEMMRTLAALTTSITEARAQHSSAGAQDSCYGDLMVRLSNLIEKLSI